MTAFDPAVKSLPKELSRVSLAADIAAALNGADAAVICTEWPQFRQADWPKIVPQMRSAVFVDANRFLEKELKSIAGVEHLSVGRAHMKRHELHELPRIQLQILVQEFVQIRATPSSMKLKNVNALITGGSQGLGKVIAEHFLREGANVVICARSEKELLATRDELAKKFPAQKVSGQNLRRFR